MIFGLRFFKRSGKWYMDNDLEISVTDCNRMDQVCEIVRIAYPHQEFIIEIISAKDPQADAIFYPCLLL